MNVGMVGLGRLGLPVAVAMSRKHHVNGFDVNPKLMCKRKYQHLELGPTLKNDFQDHFDNADISFVSLEKLVKTSDIIFVAVQTPHQPLYEGVTRLPDQRADFDYTYLIKAVKDLSKLVEKHQTVVVISTVLPGTMRQYILPLLKDKCNFAYQPMFIAMGTVMNDFLHPEFVLLGSNDKGTDVVRDFYMDYYGEDLSSTMSVESAELTKVAYNTYISMKVVYANTIMEICHKSPGCHIDSVMSCLSKATNRLMSPKYLKGGMADGGGCHPRDNIALSWLANKLNLSCNLFDDIMIAREKQTEWLAKLFMKYDLPKVILGKAFKPETNITTGSGAILLANILEEFGEKFEIYDPHVDGGEFNFGPSAFFIATKHKCFLDIAFPAGSIILDPHRYIKEKPGITVIAIGK